MFATIFLPNFYLQAASRHQPELQTKPAALIAEQEKKLVVMELNEAAISAGIRKGMTPSQALARFLPIIIKTRACAQEKLIQEILLYHAFMLSPYVEATTLGVSTIQFTNNRELTGKISRVLEQLRKCEITAQAGIAPQPDLSFLAAHLARPILKVDDATSFLEPLPIETLRLAV